MDAPANPAHPRIKNKDPEHILLRIQLLVKMNGLEPSTPCMSSRYSNQLSYTFE